MQKQPLYCIWVFLPVSQTCPIFDQQAARSSLWHLIRPARHCFDILPRACRHNLTAGSPMGSESCSASACPSQCQHTIGSPCCHCTVSRLLSLVSHPWQTYQTGTTPRRPGRPLGQSEAVSRQQADGVFFIPAHPRNGLFS